jgi:hypothetical protein
MEFLMYLLIHSKPSGKSYQAFNLYGQVLKEAIQTVYDHSPACHTINQAEEVIQGATNQQCQFLADQTVQWFKLVAPKRDLDPDIMVKFVDDKTPRVAHILFQNRHNDHEMGRITGPDIDKISEMLNLDIDPVKFRKKLSLFTDEDPIIQGETIKNWMVNSGKILHGQHYKTDKHIELNIDFIHLAEDGNRYAITEGNWAHLLI